MIGGVWDVSIAEASSVVESPVIFTSLAWKSFDDEELLEELLLELLELLELWELLEPEELDVELL